MLITGNGRGKERIESEKKVWFCNIHIDIHLLWTFSAIDRLMLSRKELCLKALLTDYKSGQQQM